MNEDEVRELIQQGEGQQVEFKRSFAEEKDAIISLCAFTHAEGGTVFIGVKDDGCIDGADLGKNTIENFANKVKQNSQPPLTPSIQSISLAGKTVVVTSIQKAAPGQLFYAFNTPYIRVGKTNQVMSPDQQRSRLMSGQDSSEHSAGRKQSGNMPVKPPEFRIELLEARFVRTFDAETKEPRTALYWEVLTTLSPNKIMQIGDITLVLSNGMRIKAQEKPTNMLERTESHWLRFALPNKAMGVLQGHISVLAGGYMWHTDEFEFKVDGLNLSRIIRP